LSAPSRSRGCARSSGAWTRRTASASTRTSRPPERGPLEAWSYAVAVTQEEGDVESSTGPGSSEAMAPRSCAWCGAPEASPEATTCAGCGAALAQRETIGDLAIPGLTTVDAALQDYDKRPLHLRGPSPSQGMAPALIVGAMAGGPIGLMAIGGVAAVAGAEFLGTRRDAASLAEIGKPSEVALQALSHIVEIAATAPTEATTAPDAAAADDGRSIWRDLPASPFDAQTEPDHDE